MSRKAVVRRGGALALSVIMLGALAPRAALGATGAPTYTDVTHVPVSGVLALADSTTQQVSGFLNIQKFANRNGQLVAVGTLTTQSTSVPQNLTVEVPVAFGDPTCEILQLTLGPLHLDLLGLVVDLNQVNLNITAQGGSGNLLGNLLCAVANLLNGTGGGGGGLTAVTNLLNQILGILQTAGL